jgi:hypothetical protein
MKNLLSPKRHKRLKIENYLANISSLCLVCLFVATLLGVFVALIQKNETTAHSAMATKSNVIASLSFRKAHARGAVYNDGHQK